MNKNNKQQDSRVLLLIFGLLIVGIAVLFTISQVKVVYIGNEVLDINITEPRDTRGVEVSIQDYTGELESYFLINVKGNGTLTNDAMMFSNSINVSDTTGCVVGEAIYLYNNESSFQALISGITGNTISFTPILDRDFYSNNSYYECGSTNLGVDGSVNPVTYCIHPPTNISWDIETLTINFIDNADMDASLFGSRAALTNGLLIRKTNGDYNNLFMIYNNNGFILRGFDYLNIPKAPSGVYIADFSLKFDKSYGSIINLKGEDGDCIEIIVSDDLTSQTRIVASVAGHRTNQ